ncbi:MAG: hypothetical protein K6C69_04220 [Lachnospiraceae bacterium]|nr:hypothetical protein [Lachnospiraceae bacterium]
MASINLSNYTNANYYGTSSSGVSTLFSSLSTSSTSSMASLVTDYNSIKTGSYGKLLKTYYAQNTAKAEKEDSTTTDHSKTKTATQTALSTTKADANALKKSIDKLTSTEDDNLFEDYQVEDVYSAVNSFVKNYNETITDAQSSTNSSIQNAGASMASLTGAMSNSLEAIGITENADHTLTLDEDTFKNADADTVKSLFHGNKSYASTIGSNASIISSAATNALSASSAVSYTANGTYSANNLVGSLYSSYF